MTGTSMLALQTAIYSRLSGDATLAAMVSGVYDHVPQGQAFPYVRIGNVTEVPDNLFGKVGRAATVTISVFSQGQGYKEALTIAGRVQQLLDGASLSVTGYACVDVSFEWSATLTEGDGITRHVPMRFRCLLEES
jgi:hypothetical protein